MLKQAPKKSLIETAIALVAITFLVLAIFLTSQFFNKAKQRAFIVQVQQYNRAVEEFSVLYHGLPGDLKKTQDYRLSAQNTDGNGDNLITDKNRQIEQANGEIKNFWHHLASSNLLNQGFGNKNANQSNFQKTKSTFKTSSKIGVFPLSKLGNEVGIAAFAVGGKNYFQAGVGLVLENKIIAKDESLTASEAFNVDYKIDDGDPSRGLVVAVGGQSLNQSPNPKCAAKNSYNNQNSSASCQIRIEILGEK